MSNTPFVEELLPAPDPARCCELLAALPYRAVSRQRGEGHAARPLLLSDGRPGRRRAQQRSADRVRRSVDGHAARRLRRRARRGSGAAGAARRRTGGRASAVSGRRRRLPRLRLGARARAPAGAAPRGPHAAGRGVRRVRLGARVGPRRSRAHGSSPPVSRRPLRHPRSSAPPSAPRPSASASRPTPCRRRLGPRANRSTGWLFRRGPRPRRPFPSKTAGGTRASRFARPSRTAAISTRSPACANTSSPATSSRPTCRSASKRRSPNRRGRSTAVSAPAMRRRSRRTWTFPMRRC